MTLKTLATGSSGNCHVLTDGSGKMLLIEAGIPIKEIKKGCDYNVKDIVGAVVTHHHQDHAKSVKHLEKMGIPVCKPYDPDGSHAMARFGDYQIACFDMTDTDNEWLHTNHDGTLCPIYGFLIYHPEMGKLLYITDCQFSKRVFSRYAPSTILLGVDYQEEYITDEEQKRRHVYSGHMSLDTAYNFIKANRTPKLVNVIATHLSKEAARPDEVQKKLKEAAPDCYCWIAEPGMEVEL